MSYVLDYTTPRTDHAAMQKAGVVGVIRYLSRSPWKNITRGEYKALRASGFEVALVWETSATMTDGGKFAGVRDGRDASQQADDLDYPGGHVIYWAVDHGPTSAADLQRIREYGQGFNEGCSYVARPYGNDQTLNAVVGGGIADAGWQCRAWSGTPIRYSPHRVLFQRNDDPLGLGGQGYDVNDIVRADWASITANHPAATPTDVPRSQAGRPTMEDDDMLDRRFMQAKGHGEVYLVHPLGDFAHHVPTEADVPQVVYAVEQAGGRILDPPKDAEVSILEDGTKVWQVDAGVLAAFGGPS
jgi:hypothetical protein